MTTTGRMYDADEFGLRWYVRNQEQPGKSNRARNHDGGFRRSLCLTRLARYGRAAVVWAAAATIRGGLKMIYLGAPCFISRTLSFGVVCI